MRRFIDPRDKENHSFADIKVIDDLGKQFQPNSKTFL